jgi:hypothetical protein
VGFPHQLRAAHYDRQNLVFPPFCSLLPAMQSLACKPNQTSHAVSQLHNKKNNNTVTEAAQRKTHKDTDNFLVTVEP